MKITKKYLRALISEEMNKLKEDQAAKVDTAMEKMLGRTTALAGEMASLTNSAEKRLEFAKGVMKAMLNIDLDDEKAKGPVRSLANALKVAVRGDQDAKALDLKAKAAGASKAPAPAAGKTGDALDAISATKGKG